MLGGGAKPILELIEQGLKEIGYTDGSLRRDYVFADLLGASDAVRSISLAAFGQEPPSYRNACFGVLTSTPGVNVAAYRALGAPQLFELDGAGVRRWKVTAGGLPEFLEGIEADKILTSIREHREEWSPEHILRAKSIAFDAAPAQLDFFDAGLLPAIEAVVHTKLESLLRDTLATSRAVYQERHLTPVPYPKLFRLVFRLLAAKLFADRGEPGDWMQADPSSVISAVEQFYFGTSAVEPALEDTAVQRAAWSKIRSAFHLQNISVEALAYVYENTLVDEETRRRYGIHSTPREVAEYVVRRLPMENLPMDQRRVFEPFSGHAAFLIAALGRIRSLLPAKTPPAARHDYFVRMLSGMELDPFAREVARLSLMLADYPNPDGWRLLDGDVFSSPLFEKEISGAGVMLCNPPFEDFSSSDQARYTGLRSVNKAAETLLRTLQRPPSLLGFVLPRTFIDGRRYRDARRELADTYGSLEIVALPDSAFRHSRMETVLLIAHDRSRPFTRLRCAEVSKRDYTNFVRTAQPTWEQADTTGCRDDAVPAGSPVLWLRPLRRVWHAVDGLSELKDVADIRNGIYYGLSLRKESQQLVSKIPRDGFHPGLVSVSDGFEPLVIPSHVYINTDPAVMYGRSKAHLFPWDRPKVIVNRVRLSRGHWIVAGAPDRRGLVVYHLFHAVWPTGDVPLDVIAAVVSGPLANAFMGLHRTSRDNRIATLKRIPVPRFRSESIEAITAAVNAYRNARLDWLQSHPSDRTIEQRCREALLQMDAELLAAYDLPPRLERELLDYFAGHRRPGPVEFDRYYPEDLRPALPLRMIISGGLQRAAAAQTLQRLPVIHDPVISEMVTDLE